MKKFLLFVLAAFAFAACEQAPIEEQSGVRTDAPETIRVGFEDDETRIQLNEAQKTVWTKEDLVSVFYRSDANQKWQYQGETGERVGDLKRVSAGTATESTKRVVVVYPYNENYYINTETYNIQASLPAVQNYLKDSYGTNGNIMISSSEYNQFSLKSVCGWLKLQLTGDGEVVNSIKFRGNNGEQVAGELYINSSDATAVLASDMGGTDDNTAGGNLVFDDTILTEVTLDCGEGVELGAEATAFYIALPPQTFANGFTVEIEDTDGYAMEQSTAKTFVVERNTISPMAALEFVNPTQPTPANNEIWYTNGSTTEATTPNKTNVFGANIVSNTYDIDKECWVIKFDDKVTSIGDYAFEDCTSLTSVTIPDCVTTIGEYTFYNCSSLTSITIPDCVTSIGRDAFSNCSSLTSVTIPDSVTTIGEWAFYGCSSLQEFNGKFASEDDRCLIIDGVLNYFAPAGLTEYTIPDSVTTIGDNAFRGCSSLTSITIPDSVTKIGNNAFYLCESLTSLTIPDSVTTIGELAFRSCSLTSITIPDSVTTIGNNAFLDCSSLQEFKGKFASEDGRCLIIDGILNFFAPVGLTEYTIPDSVTTIGDYAFRFCSRLTSVTIGDSVTTIGKEAFRSCSSLTSVTIPDSVTTIGSDAFSGCTGELIINSKIIENNYTSTPSWLSGAKFTKLTIGDSVTTIGDYAFYQCDSLTSVTIPDSATTIRYCAFLDCDSLTSVTIPNSVTKIGNYAFYDCESLTSVYCKATTPPAGGSSMFSNNASGRKIYVPKESVEAYKSEWSWSGYKSYIVGYNF